MSFEVHPLRGGIGSEIIGLDLDRAIDQVTTDVLNQAWLEAGILLFRGAGTSSERHLRLSRVFGELEVHPIESIRLPEHDEIIRLVQDDERQQMTYSVEGEPLVGLIPFHTDLIYTTTPNRGAVLRMIEKPDRGGETGWVDTAAAYDALSEGMKKQIASLEVRFRFVSNLEEMRFGKPPGIEADDFGNIEYPDFPDVAHPLVWTHPLSGRQSLALSTVQLVEVLEMDREEGDAILERLVEHALDSRFTYVHDWEEGDMVLWDNWRTMHKAFGAPPGHDRVVHRTTMKGEHEIGRLL